ncbi:MAG: phosphoglucosamine mutase [Rickettsiales bacterium]|nr:phosphoglucosamine mutase [Rickettsiales bacterium]
MSKRSLFGTDGIRGTANSFPMTAQSAMKIGMATAKYFMKNNHKHHVVIGKDTRLSGYMIEPALVSGFVSMGMDVTLLGPLPTPAIAMLTRSLRADIGVMISASHNPYMDNGIKIFGPNGIKLSDAIEAEIEHILNSNVESHLASPDKLGRVQRLEDQFGRYVEFIKSTFPKDQTLEGLKIVIDCAHGAAYKVAPKVLWELGAEIIPLGVSPDGFNINEGCGSTHPELLQQTVVESKADIGIALDGDADRVIICDENGHIVDGDQILALIATLYKKHGKLQGNTVVATQMSNLGLEAYLKSLDIALIRTKIGDRYVAECMRQHDYNVGGENSGHIILRDFTTTGDGLLAAIQVLSAMILEQKTASEATNLFAPYPQKLKNIRFSGASPLESPSIKAYIKQIEQEMGTEGRVLVRKSGTENLIRVMAEAKDPSRVDEAVDSISKEIAQTQVS